jgi:hypothetical protein
MWLKEVGYEKSLGTRWLRKEVMEKVLLGKEVIRKLLVTT